VFVDELELTLRGGRGGDGCVSLHREKYVQRGGPDGGDGGDGGDLVLLPSVHVNTLYHLTGRPVVAAADGAPGRSGNCGGADAEDLVLEVPVGTLVLDAARGHVLKDLDRPGVPFVVAAGGRGGRGNARFATPTRRTPRAAEPGASGEERRVRLSLKLIADVGLVGLPNAGKSTLLATMTRARPKIAGYPFTTLEPHLGIAAGPDGRTFVIADIPGLIEGAHEGKGLGDRFLKHVERTRVLLHLVDCSSEALDEPARAWQVVREELRRYSPALAERPALVVATKVEDDASRQRARRLADDTGRPVQVISAATGAGLRELVGAVLALLDRRTA
jgi:GTP-binding protein